MHEADMYLAEGFVAADKHSLGEGEEVEKQRFRWVIEIWRCSSGKRGCPVPASTRSSPRTAAGSTGWQKRRLSARKRPLQVWAAWRLCASAR
jgi:hypothetical protein